MKIDKIITQPTEIEILDVTLLSEEEHEKCKSIIPEMNEWWWLRSPGSSQHSAADVKSDSSLHSNRVDFELVVVRPALFILKSPSLRIGDKFNLAGYTWTVIDETIAICNNHIGIHCFRENWKAEDANVYEASDVKKYLENWAKEALCDH